MFCKSKNKSLAYKQISHIKLVPYILIQVSKEVATFGFMIQTSRYNINNLVI